MEFFEFLNIYFMDFITFLYRILVKKGSKRGMICGQASHDVWHHKNKSQKASKCAHVAPACRKVCHAMCM